MTRSGMTKKNFWLRLEVAEALRRRAFEERRTEAEIIREAVMAMVKQWM